MATTVRPKKTVRPKTIEIHHKQGAMGMVDVWRGDALTASTHPLNLVEFNHVVFTCQRFGIPLVDKGAKTETLG